MNIRDFFFRTKKGDLPTWKWNHLRALRTALAAVAGAFLVVGLVLYLLFAGDRPLQVIGTPARFDEDGRITYTALFLQRTIPSRRYAEADSVAAAAIRKRYFRNRTDGGPELDRVSAYKVRDLGTNVAIKNTYADFEVPQNERP